VTPLVLAKRGDEQHVHATGTVDLDEPAGRQLGHQMLNVAVVIREQGALNPAWPVLKPAVSVGDRPQAGEQQASHRLALCQQIICEE
jgi:hypothetical protein